MQRHRIRTRLPLIALAVLALSCGYFAYRTARLAAQNRELAGTVGTLRDSIGELEGNLSLSAYERDRITAILDETQQYAHELATKTERLAEEVDEYEKLNRLDPELLKKYSKVYFLNEHYEPQAVEPIEAQYVSGDKTITFHADALPYLLSLLDDAADAGLSLRVASGYRSFDTQAALKSRYTVLYGSGANRFSADQGYSEHQLGTTVDFTTARTGTLSASFDTTPEFRWLTEHAHGYGFILSYPRDNQYYIYEPWHWRFVGIDLATDLHATNTSFYGLDQREIDEYLLRIFE